jgi:integrase/recombinase XerD
MAHLDARMAPSVPMTGDLIDTYTDHMRRRGLATGTIDKRTSALRMLAAHGPLLELDTETIERFLDARRGRGGGLDARTRVCWLSHLRCFYQWAVAHEHTTVDPTARLVRPRLRRRLPRPVSECDYQRAVTSAPTALLRAWLLLAGNAGLRCAEIAGLAGGDVGERSIRVLGKGGRERVIPMHPRIEPVARTWPSSGPVFVDAATGLPYTAAQVSRLVGAHLRRAGITASAHQLRHRFASEVYAATGDLAVVAELCGHESIETTRIYALVSVERRAHAVCAIA